MLVCFVIFPHQGKSYFGVVPSRPGCLLGTVGKDWFERIPIKAGRLDGVFPQGTLGREMACGASKVNGEC